MSFKNEVLAKLGGIDSKQTDHTIQLAVNNKILEEHHRRSTNLEARIIPIEQHVMFISKAMKISGAAITLAAAAVSILHYLGRLPK